MRESVNPAKGTGALTPYGRHRVIVPVHIPYLDGYFSEARAVLDRCLRSLRATAEGLVAVTLISDGSCPEVLDDLAAQVEAGWVDQLVVQAPNRGKVDSVVAVARASHEELFTVADADVLFRRGWVAAVESLLAAFPECGFASLFPSPNVVYGPTSATLLGALARRELRIEAVPQLDELDRFAAGIGNPAHYPEAFRQRRVVARRGGVTAVVGAPHFVFTWRREVLVGVPPEPSRRAVGDSEVRWLDEPGDRLGYWRLTTADTYAQHMGNVVEPWMDDELDLLDGPGAPPTPRPPLPPARRPLLGRLPWRLRAGLAARVVRPWLDARLRRAAVLAGARR